METNVLHFLPSKSPSSTTSTHTNTSIRRIQPTQIFFPRRGQCLKLSSATNSPGKGEDTPQPAAPTVTPPDAVKVRFKRVSRRRGKKKRDESGQPVKAQAASDPPKKWEDMSLSEKAIEAYMGEKGMLFWLNKFAYASIFLVIGGWIVFRFVGPALNLYQLDTPPLSPSSVFKGS